MKYRLKKDPSIEAAYDFENKKFKTTNLIYLTGPKKGYSFVLNNCVLEREWEKVEPPKVLDFTPEQIEQIGKPYKPNVTPHYIPKPPAVIEYEEKKKRSYMNTELPSFEEVCDMFGPILKRINEKSNYVRFKDETTLHIRNYKLKLYTVENIWEQLTQKGLQSARNNDKDRPFAFMLESRQDFDTFAEVIINTLQTKND